MRKKIIEAAPFGHGSVWQFYRTVTEGSGLNIRSDA
jgi:hypothetical protein